MEVVEEETEYRVLEPRECFRCEEKCYPYRIMTETWSGTTTFPDGVYRVYWHCNNCGNWFKIMETIGNFHLVDKEELEKMVVDVHRHHTLAYIEETKDETIIHSE